MRAQGQLLAERTESSRNKNKRAQARLACRDSLLQQLGTEREEALRQLAASEARIAKADAEAALLREHVFALEARLQESESEMLRNLGDARQLAVVLESTSWRMTWPLRRALSGYPSLSLTVRRLAKLGWWTATGQLTRHARYWKAARRARSAVPPPISLPAPDAGTTFGDTRIVEAEAAPAQPILQRPLGWLTPNSRDAYDCWLLDNPWHWRQEAPLRRRLGTLGNSLPLFSVLMPVFRPDLAWLRRAVESVRHQVYENWELCIADDATGDPEVTSALQSFAAADLRIKVIIRESNGHISRATNTAAKLASGDFFVLLDQDDELSPDALGELALHLAEQPTTDMLYSDSDKIDENERRYDPHFKPDFSPELLLAYMYAGQTLCIRGTLWNELGGLRPGYEGSQDHDLALRASERARRVGHIPKVLYHWRCLPGSTASSG